MKRLKKKYDKPLRPWDKKRIEQEQEILNRYGLRRKKEIWIAEGSLRKFRRLARTLAAKHDKEKEKILIDKLVKLGLLEGNAQLDDVLSLNVEKLLDRRLQTIVHLKGISRTSKQARQMILHGHVTVAGKKVKYPSYIVKRDEEEMIQADMQTKGGK